MKIICFSIEALAEVLLHGTPEINFAFLFGSAQDGEVKAASDIDIGVYLNCPTSADLILRIVRIVEDTAKARCDLTILNTASEVLRFEALKGKLLFFREGKIDEYARFYSLTCREYEDTMFLMQRQLALRGYTE